MNRKPFRSLLLTLPLVLLALFCVAGCGGRGDEVYLEAGLVKLRRGDFEGARQLLEKAARARPLDATAHANLGVAYWRQKKHVQAVESLKTAAGLAKTDSRPLEYLGTVYYSRGNWDEARVAFDEAYRLSPQSPRILTSMAAVELGAGDTDAAEGILKQALAIDPVHPAALYNLAMLRLGARNDPVGAREALANYLAVAADTHHKEIAEKKLKALGKPDSGAPRPPPPVAPDPPAPRDSPRPLSAAEKTVARARKALDTGEIEQALILFKQAIRKDPAYADALWELAVLYDRRLEDGERAARTYREFRNLFPDSPRARQAADRLAELAAPGDSAFSTAESAFREGLARYRRKDMKGAVQAYARALELDPGFANAAYNLGLACKGAGQPAAARDAFRRALQIRPDMTQARYMLAVVDRALGADDATVTELQHVLRLDPDYVKAHFLLGLVLHERNRNAEARRHLQRCLELEPDGALAARARELLQEGSP